VVSIEGSRSFGVGVARAVTAAGPVVVHAGRAGPAVADRRPSARPWVGRPRGRASPSSQPLLSAGRPLLRPAATLPAVPATGAALRLRVAVAAPAPAGAALSERGRAGGGSGASAVSSSSAMSSGSAPSSSAYSSVSGASSAFFLTGGLSTHGVGQRVPRQRSWCVRSGGCRGTPDLWETLLTRRSCGPLSTRWRCEWMGSRRRRRL
jgi:hypothetical protein